MRPRLIWLVLAMPGPAAAVAHADEAVVLLVRGTPDHGIVLGSLRVPPALKAPSRRPAGANRLRAIALCQGRSVPVQLIPAADRIRQDWRVAMKLPGGGAHRVTLKLRWETAPPMPTQRVEVATTRIRTVHEAKRDGGLPGKWRFLGTKKSFDSLLWGDRVHHPRLGGFLLRQDKTARVEQVGRGPLCDVVRVTGHYCNPAGRKPASAPKAVYEWTYFRDLPLIHLRAVTTQSRPFSWRELHVLEMRFQDRSFGAWAGGEPMRQGTFRGTQKSFGFETWALLREGPCGLGVLRSGRAIFHDGHGGYGTYLHGRGTLAWRPWGDTRRETTCWLWAGAEADPVRAVRHAATALPTDAVVVTTTPHLLARIEAAREKARAIEKPAARRQALYAVAMAEKFQAQGRWADASAWLEGHAPQDWATLFAGDLALTVQEEDAGLRCASLFDLKQSVELTAEPAPLFEITMRQVAGGKTVVVRSDAGWSDVAVTPGTKCLTLQWRGAKAVGLDKLRVVARADADGEAHAVRWRLKVTNPHAGWGVWRVVFPQVALGRFADDLAVLDPGASGRVEPHPWRKPYTYRGQYPSGWASMQMLAAYDPAGRTGLYFALHDPTAATKDLLAEARPERHDLRLACRIPPPHAGVGGKSYTLPGKAVWQLLRGDWFDAAMIYRAWVRAEAPWYPRPDHLGRADTPAWMRELCLWGMLSGDPKGALAQGRAFQKAAGMDCAFHWYNWHKIPFDNDYPHYFPPRDGFKDAVATLQKAPIAVMPYINGRLWDTRDKGATDFEYTKLARPAATKDPGGTVHTETYGSKEADGSRVRLAAMCPATKLWQDKVRGIVLRLMTEQGVRAVYIDQIAAARPRLCYDKTHGHPVGGGGWWVASYNAMLEQLQADLPPGCAITTECNAEPYLKWFDGYLTWHWQYQGQVPAFPAVYGGAIQMFGRAYRGGPTKDQALRMKAGQQLVFGEQIGWISANVAKEKANMAFLVQMARLRKRLLAYFVSGQMARPPKLAPAGRGTLPTVTADWQWHGVWPITTDAVLTGAWELPEGKRLVLLFVNVTDKPVTARVRFDPAAYGLGAQRDRLVMRTLTAAGSAGEHPIPAGPDLRTVFAPHQAVAWEIRPR